MDECDLEDIRFLVYTTPKQVSGIPKKKPEIMEIKVDGGAGNLVRSLKSSRIITPVFQVREQLQKK